MSRVWRGRVRHRVWKAFVALERAVSTGELVKWVWPRLPRHRSIHYHRARLAAREIADPVVRATTGKGRPWLWRLRETRL